MTDTHSPLVTETPRAMHTPGPWEVERGHQSNRIYGIRGVTNWNFLKRGASVQSQANARLIAAAPLMLVALMSAELRFRGTQFEDGATHNEVRDAIAKAIGDSQ